MESSMKITLSWHRSLLLVALLSSPLRVQVFSQEATHQGPAVMFNQGKLEVSENGRFLQHENGKPFFYLGETAWELFHRLSLDETEMFLENRRQKGFTVIQAVLLAELDGLRTPSVNGELPLVDLDPSKAQ